MSTPLEVVPGMQFGLYRNRISDNQLDLLFVFERKVEQELESHTSISYHLLHNSLLLSYCDPLRKWSQIVSFIPIFF